MFDSLFSGLERNVPYPGMLLLSGHKYHLEQEPREVYLILSLDEDVVTAVRLGVRSEVLVNHVLPEWADGATAPQVIYIGSEANREYCVAVGTVYSTEDADSRPFLARLAHRLVQVDISYPAETVLPELSGLRFFAGFRQWDVRELMNEIVSDIWYVAPALASDVLANGTTDVWADVMRRQEMPLPLYSTHPRDVNLN
ncbi:MAG: YqgE/AlgH family protein [Corynebacterium sp.]|nr:YqgE/AlgH family protein [Corynebacterium sp.]